MLSLDYILEGSISYINGVRPDFPRNTACWSLNNYDIIHMRFYAWAENPCKIAMLSHLWPFF